MKQKKKETKARLDKREMKQVNEERKNYKKIKLNEIAEYQNEKGKYMNKDTNQPEKE